MGEVNPYVTPGSALIEQVAVPMARPRGYRVYKWCSLIYGVLFAMVCVALVYQQILSVSVVGVLMLLMILAPLISFLLLAARTRRLLYAWLPMHLMGLLVLLGLGVESLGEVDRFKTGFTAFMIVCSALSWFASLYFQWRLGNK